MKAPSTKTFCFLYRFLLSSKLNVCYRQVAAQILGVWHSNRIYNLMSFWCYCNHPKCIFWQKMTPYSLYTILLEHPSHSGNLWVSPYNVKYVRERDCMSPVYFYLQNEHMNLRASWLKRRIQNPVKHLRWSFLKNIWRLKAVNYFRKKLHLRCSTGF